MIYFHLSSMRHKVLLKISGFIQYVTLGVVTSDKKNKIYIVCVCCVCV